jgi:hypothetical protein
MKKKLSKGGTTFKEMLSSWHLTSKKKYIFTFDEGTLNDKG